MQVRKPVEVGPGPFAQHAVDQRGGKTQPFQLARRRRIGELRGRPPQPLVGGGGAFGYCSPITQVRNTCPFAEFFALLRMDGAFPGADLAYRARIAS